MGRNERIASFGRIGFDPFRLFDARKRRFFAEWESVRQKCTHFGRFGGIVRSVGGIALWWLYICDIMQSVILLKTYHND